MPYKPDGTFERPVTLRDIVKPGVKIEPEQFDVNNDDYDEVLATLATKAELSQGLQNHSHPLSQITNSGALAGKETIDSIALIDVDILTEDRLHPDVRTKLNYSSPVNSNAMQSPTANDDSTAGWEPGSLWIVPSAGESYRCISAASGQAVWAKTTLTADELGGLAFQNPEAVDISGGAVDVGSLKRNGADIFPLAIKDEGVEKTSGAKSLDFTGAGVIASDDGNGNVIVDIDASGATQAAEALQTANQALAAAQSAAENSNQASEIVDDSATSSPPGSVAETLLGKAALDHDHDAAYAPTDHSHTIADLADGDGFVRMTDAERVAVAGIGASADLIVMSMLAARTAGDRINMIDGIVDPFADESDVDVAVSSGQTFSGGKYTNVSGGATDYANAGGMGDRTGIITATASNSGIINTGDISNLLDGDSSQTFDFHNGVDVAGAWFLFDFGSAKVITESRWVQSSSSSHGDWRWQGSNDGSAFENIGGVFTLGGATTSLCTELAGNVTGYRYYRLLGVSGSTSNSPWEYEIEFKIGDPAGGGDMTVQSTSFVAASQPTTAQLRVMLKPVDPITINTDVVCSVSRDGGATWSAATLSEIMTQTDGAKLYVDDDINVSGQPAGQDMKWRIETHNTKSVELTGIGLSWEL